MYCLREHLHRLRSSTDPAPTGPIELFVRLGPRDFNVAPVAVASVREALTNHVDGITVVTPESHVPDARRLFPEAVVLADEELLPIELRHLILTVAPAGRVTWVTQQFLTLVYVTGRARLPCLVWDADLVLLRPTTVLRRGVASLPISLEHHGPYFKVIRRLLPGLPLPVWSSTVAHHLLMVPDLLREMLAEIEARANRHPWWCVILEHIDRREVSCFSEYELYGQWVRTRHPELVELEGFRNATLPRARLSRAAVDRLRRRNSIDSLSLHWWL